MQTETSKAPAVLMSQRSHALPRWLINFSKKLGVALLASSLCLAILEVAFRIAGYKAIYQFYSKPDVFWRHDPLLGWSMEPHSEGEYVGPRPFPIEFHAHVRINSMGLRGPELTDVPAGGFRVLVLGDSVVAAFEVEEENTFESLLQRQLTNDMGAPIQVINAGVRGYGTDQSYLFYRDRGRGFHPDVVLFVTAVNDLEDNTTLHRARRPFGKPAFALAPDSSLHLVGSPVPEYPFCSGYRLDAEFVPTRIDTNREQFMCWLQTSLSDHSALFTYATLRIQQNTGLVYRIFRLGVPSQQATIMSAPGDASAVSPAGRLTTRLIREIGALARKDGARFLIASDESEIAPLDLRALAEDQIDIFHRNQIKIDDSYATLMYKNDGHFNELGHARLAAHLAPVLLKHLRSVAASRGGPTAKGPDAAPTPNAASPARL